MEGGTEACRIDALMRVVRKVLLFFKMKNDFGSFIWGF